MGSNLKIKSRGDFRLRGKGRKWGIKQHKKEKPHVFRPIAAKPPAAFSDPWEVLRFVLMTEKAVRAIEGENMLVFIAKRDADKKTIKAAFEKAFASKVKSVRTVLDQEGRKKAMIKLAQPGAASEIAIKLGII
ncbi:MAG: 50S ribosomal protein L23 [Candidatus Aenigmatarchaeota archaeon]